MRTEGVGWDIRFWSLCCLYHYGVKESKRKFSAAGAAERGTEEEEEEEKYPSESVTSAWFFCLSISIRIGLVRRIDAVRIVGFGEEESRGTGRGGMGGRRGLGRAV